MSAKPCACKGIRTCLACEPASLPPVIPNDWSRALLFCPLCRLAHPHADPCESGLRFPGIQIVPNFITEAEEASIATAIDATPFADSQSGRRKQDFGPQVNFKRRKVRTARFTGLPPYAEPLVNRLHAAAGLGDFAPVELCNLDYSPHRGSAIDPHHDDAWLWGERLVTLNLLSDSWLTMTLPPGADVSSVIAADWLGDASDARQWELEPVVKVPMRRRSLLVVSGPARHFWQHAVLRGDVVLRRLAMTFRELSPEFALGGAKEEVGRELLAIAARFEGRSVLEHVSATAAGN